MDYFTICIRLKNSHACDHVYITIPMSIIMLHFVDNNNKMKRKERKHASAIQLCINIIFLQTYQCIQTQMQYISIIINNSICSTCLFIYMVGI